MTELLGRYRWPLIGGSAGLIIAILLFTIGLFKAIILLVLVGIGVAVGLYISRTGLLDDYFK